eukprot:g36792.t1
MIDARSDAVTYNVWVGEAVLNKHVSHNEGNILETGQEQNMPGSSEQPERLSEPVVSHTPSSIKETSESEMDTAHLTASKPLLLEDEDEFSSKMLQTQV